MRFLIDAVLPASLATEAPPGIDFERWEKTRDQKDNDLVYYAAKKGIRGVIFFGRNSLKQPGLRQLAEEKGIALVAIDASDPIQARERLLRHIIKLPSKLSENQFFLILASEVRGV